jgi:hypothetical protein
VSLSVVVTREAGLAGRDLPGMRSVAGAARNRRMFLLLVESLPIGVAGRATHHGLGFRLSKVAGVAGHGHHGRRRVDLMARDTIQRWPVTCSVTKVTEDLAVFAFERPWMPGFCANGCGTPKRQ